MYIITTFPSLKIDIEKFSAIKRHLLSFGYDRLKQTGDKGSRKKTNNQWFETQDTIGYWDDFSKQKIIYPDIMRMPSKRELLETYPYIYLDDKNYYAEATNFIMTGEEIDLVFTFLISDLGFFVFSRFYSGPQFDSTGFRYKKAYLEETFIPTFKISDQIEIRKLISDGNSNFIKNIDSVLFAILKLTSEEQELIKNYKFSLLDTTFNE